MEKRAWMTKGPHQPTVAGLARAKCELEEAIKELCTEFTDYFGYSVTIQEIALLNPITRDHIPLVRVIVRMK